MTGVTCGSPQLNSTFAEDMLTTNLHRPECESLINTNVLQHGVHLRNTMCYFFAGEVGKIRDKVVVTILKLDERGGGSGVSRQLTMCASATQHAASLTPCQAVYKHVSNLHHVREQLDIHDNCNLDMVNRVSAEPTENQRHTYE